MTPTIPISLSLLLSFSFSFSSPLIAARCFFSPRRSSLFISRYFLASLLHRARSLARPISFLFFAPLFGYPSARSQYRRGRQAGRQRAREREIREEIQKGCTRAHSFSSTLSPSRFFFSFSPFASERSSSSLFLRFLGLDFEVPI